MGDSYLSSGLRVELCVRMKKKPRSLDLFTHLMQQLELTWGRM